jgi:hypothetical protein
MRFFGHLVVQILGVKVFLGVHKMFYVIKFFGVKNYLGQKNVGLKNGIQKLDVKKILTKN